MVDVLILLWTALTSLFRSRARLEAEILVLRQQINVLRRNSPKRFVFGTFDRLVLVGPGCLAPSPTPRKLPRRDRNAWLGREDSNLRMAESKSAALPLGYAPTGDEGNGGRTGYRRFPVVAAGL